MCQGLIGDWVLTVPWIIYIKQSNQTALWFSNMPGPPHSINAPHCSKTLECSLPQKTAHWWPSYYCQSDYNKMHDTSAHTVCICTKMCLRLGGEGGSSLQAPPSISCLFKKYQVTEAETSAIVLTVTAEW